MHQDRQPELQHSLAQIGRAAIEIACTAANPQTGHSALQAAERISAVALHILATNLGGTYQWIPNTETLERRRRNTRILLEFRGNNQAELAIRYDISVRTVNRVVAAARDAERPPQRNRAVSA